MPKWYVVWKGRRPGIYESWDEARKQVDGYTEAEHMAFASLADAKRAFAATYAEALRKRIGRDPRPHISAEPRTTYRAGQSERPARVHRIKAEKGSGPILPSYCVDAACAHNPGPLEYRCVETETRKQVFHEGPFPNGTNNIGEFLAIVHALMLFNEQGIGLPIYSDSVNALIWVRAKKARTRLVPNRRNARLFELLAEAEAWLASHTWKNKLYKWNTEAWGENPADFGRK